VAVERAVLFGSDLRLIQHGGAVDLIGDSRGDLALAAGNDNIMQALWMRLMVRKGELAPLGFPDYGSRLHEMIGEPNNQRTRVILMGFARAAVEQDPRVLKVAGVEASGTRDVVRITMQIDLITQNSPLNLVFDVRLGTR
jgi:phage baseplate assembly protein W